MTQHKTKKYWKSGSVRGYNGDGISVTATYRVPDGQTAPDTVDLRFFDNSTRPGGPSSRLRSYPVSEQGWADIPMPDPEGKFGEGINEGFSLKGQVRLEKTPAGHFLRLRFNWGQDQAHAEEGYIMMLGG
jgi:hypothetical protein